MDLYDDCGFTECNPIENLQEKFDGDIEIRDSVDSSYFLCTEQSLSSIDNVFGCIGDSVSFHGYIDEIYNPHINAAQEDYLEHIQKMTNSDDLYEIKRQAGLAEDTLHSQKYWEQCKFDANIQATKDSLFIENINQQWEIMDKYEHDLSNITHQSASISFGNSYDDRAASFLNDCRRLGVELPPSVDHTSHNNVITVDRSVNGGLISIDKTIISNTLESYHNNGKLSDNDYEYLKRKLLSC